MIEVWADVGGTFTDTFVVDGRRRLVTKVLSSGVIRVRAAEIAAPRPGDGGLGSPTRVRLSLPDEWSLANFWDGSRLSWIPADGRRVPLGTILAYDADSGWVETDRPIRLPDASSFRQGLWELDPGLEAPVLAARQLLRVPPADPLPPLEVRLGTTRGTNALLTRRGAETALVINRGFGDLPRIGEQDRPDLFALTIRKPPPLTERVVEIDGRLLASGEESEPLDEPRLREQLRSIRDAGVASLAICLMHAHVNDVHERRCEQIARELGFEEISRSSEVAPLIKLVSRAETTTLDAYLNPVLNRDVDRVWQQFGGPGRCHLRLMTSGGNLVSPAGFRGRDSILSGPAGGVVALAGVAQRAAAGAAIGLDMGGTSTDVSRYEGRIGRRYESRVAGVRVMTPMMDIHTVAAGGGSICDFRGATGDRGGRLTVGPDSAGADPGPACYGRGGPCTLTDVNLLLGRIPAERFPFPLDREAARRRLTEIASRTSQTWRHLDELAAGFFRIAVTHMAEAVRKVSTAEGSDPRAMALVGFGGAAGQHLCRVADALGMRQIIDHPDASMLSALGMGLADVGRVATRGVYKPLGRESVNEALAIAETLRRQAHGELLSELTRSAGDAEGPVAGDNPIASPIAGEIAGDERSPDFRWEWDLRHQGTESSLVCDFDPERLRRDPDPVEAVRSVFADRHRHVFGYERPGLGIEIVAVRCEATLRSPARPERDPGRSDAPRLKTRIWHQDEFLDAEQIERATLDPGDRLSGPCLVVSDNSTLVVDVGWRAIVARGGVIELSPAGPASPESPATLAGRSSSSGLSSPAVEERHHPATGGDVAGTSGPADDPVMVEVIARRLQGIAEAMGETLRRTAVSVNVKERRDFSCALFRGDGTLIANAPHVPVHLGAMGHTVRRMIEVFPRMAPGDAYLSNDPYTGGSHLPDVTLVTPVFVPPPSGQGSRLAGQGESRGGQGGPPRPNYFVASRAHHAEIGGLTPGSMPPEARTVGEEGVLIRDFALIRGGVSHEDRLRQLLESARYPSRAVRENLADVAAQLAAGEAGSRALVALAGRYGTPTIDRMMAALVRLAGDAIRGWLDRLPGRPFVFADALDDGTPVRVRLEKRGHRLVIDFAGTGPVHRYGFNATPAIVTAAIMYVLRSVTGSDLPLCDGVLRDVDLVIPEGLLRPPLADPPENSPAVVAGNVETSQRVVDVLLGALHAAAASQGTMNNVLIGDAAFGYYETIGGGSGATADGPGADAVHTHMTNTRITDPEVLESRLPLRIRRFAIRRGSGGGGRHRGGDGLVREIEFLRELTVSLITSRRLTAPYGAAGGDPGSPGRNTWIRGGEEVPLGPTVTFAARRGDRLRIETPGGGGWGPNPEAPG